VIAANIPMKIPIVYIVEARKMDMNQGRAQLYPQLKVCYELAKEEEDWNYPVFGVISTGNMWIFVKYDGKIWIESH
jgi:hypothetical protein